MEDKYKKTIEGYHNTEITLEYEFDELEDVTEDFFLCISTEDGCVLKEDGTKDEVFIGLTFEQAVEFRNHLTYLIDTFILNKTKGEGKGEDICED